VGKGVAASHGRRDDKITGVDVTWGIMATWRQVLLAPLKFFSHKEYKLLHQYLALNLSLKECI
jgi:hypothetical protein